MTGNYSRHEIPKKKRNGIVEDFELGISNERKEYSMVQGKRQEQS